MCFKRIIKNLLITLSVSIALSLSFAASCAPPVVEEPVAEEPVAEEPVAEEPVVEEPVVEEPVVEEPVVEEPKEKIIIGFAPQCYDTTDYFGQFHIGFAEEAEEIGLEFEWYGRAPLTPTDFVGHNQIIEDFITVGVDYIIASTASPHDIVSSIELANEAGIPVIYCNRLDPIEDVEVDILTYTGYSHWEGGEIAAKWALENVLEPGDEIAIIYALPGDDISMKRGNSFKEMVEEAGVVVVYEAYSEWTREKAYEETERMISTFPNLKLIYGIASHPAGGAAEAVAAAGLSGEIHVLGYGCISVEIDQIWEGLITASVFRDAQSNGRQAANAIKLHLEGKEVPQQYGMELVMAAGREGLLEIVPVEQLKLTEHWPEMEEELKKLGKISE